MYVYVRTCVHTYVCMYMTCRDKMVLVCAHIIFKVAG